MKIKAGKPAVIIFTVIVAIVMAFSQVSSVSASSKDRVNDDPTLWKQEHSSGQNSSAFSAKSTNIVHDSRFDSYKKYKGVDVSIYDGGNINWKKVRKAGIRFAIVRVGARGWGSAGTMIEDAYYKRNIEGASKAGLKVGVYFFSQAITPKEAEAEADYTLKRISPYKDKITMPVVFDYEYSGGSSGRLTKAPLSQAQKRNITDAFCKKVKKSGYTPMLYANTNFLNYHINMEDFKYPVWVAQYNRKCYYQGDYEMWQYSSTEEISGISPENEDVSFWYTKDINKYTKNSKPNDPVPAPDDRPASLDAPVVKTSVKGNTVTWKWNLVKGASKYYVYKDGEQVSETNTNKCSENMYGKDALKLSVAAAGTGKGGKEIVSKMSNEAIGYAPLRFTTKDSEGNVMAYRYEGLYYTAEGREQSGKVTMTASVTARSGLNIRKGRSALTKKTGYVKYKKTVTVLKTYSGKYENWVKIKYGKKTGYVYAAYLK